MTHGAGPYRGTRIERVELPYPDDRLPLDQSHLRFSDVARIMLLLVPFYGWMAIVSMFAREWNLGFWSFFGALLLSGVGAIVGAILWSRNRWSRTVVLERRESRITGLSARDLPVGGRIQVQRLRGHLVLWLCPRNGDESRVLVGVFPMARREDARRFVFGLASLGDYEISPAFPAP